MAVLSPRELCPEVTEGVSFRSARQVDRIDDKVICPMPRRVATVSFSTGEPIKPFWQRRSVPPTLDCEANHEILEIFLSKNSCVNSTNFGCSPPYFSGSPPCRAGNPIVRDVEFSHQRRSPLPASIIHGNTVAQDVEFFSKRPSSPLPATIMQKKSVVTTSTYRASPCVRVEGFECPSRAFECTSRETRRRVPAIA